MLPRLLSALRLADLAAIIEAAEARARENKAWLSKHRETGRRLTVSFNAMALDRTPHPEHKRLCRLVEALSLDARHQLMAVFWGRSRDRHPHPVCPANAYGPLNSASWGADNDGDAPPASQIRAATAYHRDAVH